MPRRSVHAVAVVRRSHRGSPRGIDAAADRRRLVVTGRGGRAGPGCGRSKAGVRRQRRVRGVVGRGPVVRAGGVVGSGRRRAFPLTRIGPAVIARGARAATAFGGGAVGTGCGASRRVAVIGSALRARGRHVAAAAGGGALRAVCRAAGATGLIGTAVRTLVGSIIRTACAAVAAVARGARGVRPGITAAVEPAARTCAATTAGVGELRVHEGQKRSDQQTDHRFNHGKVLSENHQVF